MWPCIRDCHNCPHAMAPHLSVLQVELCSSLSRPTLHASSTPTSCTDDNAVAEIKACELCRRHTFRCLPTHTTVSLRVAPLISKCPFLPWHCLPIRAPPFILVVRAGMPSRIRPARSVCASGCLCACRCVWGCMHVHMHAEYTHVSMCMCR